MSDINPILDAIDHCLEDWAVGPDAMRWNPNPTPGGVGSLVLDETHLWVAPANTPPPGIAVPSWVIDYEWPDTSRWDTIGYTTEPVELRIADVDTDLRPYMEAIRAEIRELAAVTEIPGWVQEQLGLNRCD